MKIVGNYSNAFSVTNTVPQGSILRPHLYLSIYKLNLSQEIKIQRCDQHVTMDFKTTSRHSAIILKL